MEVTFTPSWEGPDIIRERLDDLLELAEALELSSVVTLVEDIIYALPGHSTGSEWVFLPLPRKVAE